MKDYVLLIFVILIIGLSSSILAMNRGQMDDSNRSTFMGILEGCIVILVVVSILAVYLEEYKMEFLKVHKIHVICILALVIANVLYAAYVFGQLDSDMNVEMIAMVVNIVACAILGGVSLIRVWNRKQLEVVEVTDLQ